MKQVLLAPSDLLTPQQHEEAGRFPMLASVKLDGNRCLVHGDGLFSRTMKLQPNGNLWDHLADLRRWCHETGRMLDGEIYSHDIPFNELQSILRAKDKPIPEHVKFYAFDFFSDRAWEDEDWLSFDNRIRMLRKHYDLMRWPNVEVLMQSPVNTPAEVEEMYATMLEKGYEGLILRNPDAQYKCGRATVGENIIFKLKPFDTLDAKVIGWEQQQKVKDTAKRKTNEMGRTARTFKAEDHETVDNLGCLKVKDEQGREFNVGWGRGWDYAKRKALWDQRTTLVGRWVEVRYMVVGEKDLPRMPQLVRFRDDK